MVSPETLRRYPYFTGASDETLKAIAMASEEVRFHEGQRLFDEGDPADHLYLVTEGEVDLRYELAPGEPRIVDTLVAGDLLVWSALVPPYRTTAAAVARRRSRAMLIDARKLRELCDSDPEFGYQMMHEIAKITSSRLEGARVQLATKG